MYIRHSGPKLLAKTGILSESKITKAVSDWLYHNAGDKYLGRYYLGESCPDGSIKVIHDRWSTWENDLTFRDNTLWVHHAKSPRGLVLTDSTKSSPYLAYDLDRHSGSKLKVVHRHEVEKALCLANCLRGTKTAVEINPKNGSVKLFTFKANTTHFSISDLNRFNGLFERHLEFPCERWGDNLKKVGLPFHPEKIFIIGDRVLKKCCRKRKVAGGFEKFDCWSMTDFVSWLDTGKTTTWSSIKDILETSMANLADEDSHVQPAAEKPVVQPRLRNYSIRQFHQMDSIAKEPNARIRQHQALMILARQMKQVPTVDQALEFIKANKLYSGDWHNPKRRPRVKGILKYISRNFDPSKCSGGKISSFDRSYRRAKQLIKKPATFWKTYPRLGFDDDGMPVIKIKRKKVNLSKSDFRLYAACIIEAVFCRDDNDGVPTNFIRAIYEAHGGAWNAERCTYVRDYLESKKVVDIYDKNHQRGKCWRWREGVNWKKPNRYNPFSFPKIDNKYCLRERNITCLFADVVQLRNEPLETAKFARPPPSARGKLPLATCQS